MTAPFDHLNISAEASEVEASQLRVELQAEQERHIASSALAYRYHLSLHSFFERLRRFSQITRQECDFHIDASNTDFVSINTRIEAFKKRWGKPPRYANGAEIVLAKPPEGQKMKRETLV